MINVLHVIDSLGVGGAERQLALTLSALDPLRVRSFVCCLHEPYDVEPEIQQLGIPVYRLYASGRTKWPRAVLELRRLIRSLDIDLVHTQLFDADVVGGIAGRLTVTPVVSTLASASYDPEWLINNPSLNRFKLGFTRAVRSVVARFLNRRLVAISESVKWSAVSTLGVSSSKLTVIYRALFPSWGGPDDGIPLRAGDVDESLEGHFPIILNVGRLVAPKGQRYLIEAMPAILERFPDALLVVVGDGQLRKPLAARADNMEVVSRVKFLGKRTDIGDLIQVSDVFVFPSLSEGFGNALLEAIALGIPCVASDIPPVMEVTENGRLATIVSTQDPDQLAHAVIETASDVTQARVAARIASDAVRRRFRVEIVAEKLTRLYEECLGVVSEHTDSERSYEDSLVK